MVSVHFPLKLPLKVTPLGRHDDNMGANICNKIFKQFLPQCMQTSPFWPRQIYRMSSLGKDAWVFIASMAQHVNFLTCYAYHIIWRSIFREKSDSIIPQSVEDT